jgi:hypothetical protein
MITIACWKWERIPTGHQLPNVMDYTVDHVHKLQSMLARNLTIPYRFVCITDDPTGLQCETIPLWEKYEAGGCYHRLKVFDPDFHLLGHRFAWIDLDVVITGNVDHIFGIDADFAINGYPYRGRAEQYYNGAIVVMNRGARPQVWREFDPIASPRLMADKNEKRELIGSDQAFVSYILGPNERKFTEDDGVYEAMSLERVKRYFATTVPTHLPLPNKARIVLFSGPRDPHSSNFPWVKAHYK